MVGGNPQGLARAERELGLLSWSVALDQPYFEYQGDEVLCVKRWRPLVREIKRWQLLCRALRDFDIIHFNFGSSIMPQSLSTATNSSRYHPLIRQAYSYYAQLLDLRDLPLLKRAGKGLVVTFQGDDARQGDFCLANYEISPAMEVEPGYYSPETDARKRQRIASFAQYADRIYALNPDLLHVLPTQAQFLPYSHIDLRDWQPVDKGISESEVPVVLHAPSHRGVKGTRFVLDAIARLQAEGVPLEFILIEGLSHAEARRIYQRADLLVDQLLCGWYGGLAVELMALGKPVICYIRKGDLKFIPTQMREELPIIDATPTTLYQVLKKWLTSKKDELPKIGQLSRAYVEKWHDPLKIAAKLRGEYEAIMTAKQQASHC